MSENKRFRKVLVLIEDSNGNLLDLSEIANKLNQLNNKNEQLKQDNHSLAEKQIKLVEKITEKEQENKELKKENRMLKILYCKCKDCKHANFYIPYYAYPCIPPKCEISGNNVDFTQNACENFERLGRNSR